jgi:acetate kinase
MLASLGDAPHALIFTDAIGESEPSIRAAACAPFAFLGLDLDLQKTMPHRSTPISPPKIASSGSY